MSNSIMYQQDGYVVLETNQPEQLMTESELLTKLQQILTTLSDDLPFDVQKITSPQEQAQYLLDNYCELDLGQGQYLQWYVTRWEK
jgi:hypothetical protein